MSEIIKAIKPRLIKWFGINPTYTRYKIKQDLYFASLPKNGQYIKIIWLPDTKHTPPQKNAYIGMEGYVEGFNNVTGDFVLKCENCLLICPSSSIHYQILEPKF